MSRPKKEYCDYFSHDRDMRNHRKIKALRLKYGIQGYAIWVMFLEFLTGNDNNIFKNTDIELELLSGDFGVPTNEIIDIINYCLKLNLLVEKEGIIYSESLNERLEYVYNKRKKSKNTSDQQPRSNGKYVSNNTVDAAVSVTEMPQSKVKGIEVNKSSIDAVTISKNSKEIKDSNSWEREKKYFLNEEQYFYKISTCYKITKNDVTSFANIFLNELELAEDYKDLKELKRHFSYWLKKRKEEKERKAQFQQPDPTKVKIKLSSSPTPKYD